MPRKVNTVVSNRMRFTQSGYRTAVASTVASLRNGHSDQDFADEWGVSAGTVNNAQNKTKSLSGENLIRLGAEFGPAGLNTVLALIGLKAVRDADCCLDVSKIPHDVASALPLLIELMSDGECCDDDMRKLEKAGVVSTFLRIADGLRQRRDVVRLREVGQ